MKKISVFLLCCACFLNIGWNWHKNPKVDESIQKGYAAWQAGNLTEAMVDYEKALMLKPDHTDALNALGVLYEEVGLPKNAEEKYLTVISIDRKYLPAYFNLGILYWNQGNMKKASYYFQKRVEWGRLRDPWTIKARKALENIQKNENMGHQGTVDQGFNMMNQPISQ